jgi:hypothetical protein
VTVLLATTRRPRRTGVREAIAQGIESSVATTRRARDTLQVYVQARDEGDGGHVTIFPQPDGSRPLRRAGWYATLAAAKYHLVDRLCDPRAMGAHAMLTSRRHVDLLRVTAAACRVAR